MPQDAVLAAIAGLRADIVPTLEQLANTQSEHGERLATLEAHQGLCDEERKKVDERLGKVEGQQQWWSGRDSTILVVGGAIATVVAIIISWWRH